MEVLFKDFFAQQITTYDLFLLSSILMLAGFFRPWERLGKSGSHSQVGLVGFFIFIYILLRAIKSAVTG